MTLSGSWQFYLKTDFALKSFVSQISLWLADFIAIMASEAEMTQQEKPVYKKIVEYKKKISLVEGKRRAMFNKFEQEKVLNREKEKEIDLNLKV